MSHGTKDDHFLHSAAITSVAVLRSSPPLGLGMKQVRFLSYNLRKHFLWDDPDGGMMKDLGGFLKGVFEGDDLGGEGDGENEGVIVLDSGRLGREERGGRRRPRRG